jgi:hypothetical protein
MITLLERASLVPLLALKRPRLGFDVLTPNSGPLLLRNIVRYRVTRTTATIVVDRLDCPLLANASSRFEPSPIPGFQPRTAPVLAGMRAQFPEGVRRFLLVTMHGLYLAGLPRL